MFKKVLLVVILFSCFTSFAHKDTSYAKMFDKTTSIFITGFLYEEINKGYIMGEYANMLAKELGYKDSLLLIFRHDYTRNYPHFMKLVKHNDFISINYKKSDYSLLETLNLVEYAILTKNKTDSLSDDSLKKIESKNPSELVKKVLSKRIYRPNEIKDMENDSGFSYYVENNKYHIFHSYSNPERHENLKLTLNNIYHFEPLELYSVVVFEDIISFYYLTIGKSPVPKKATLTDIEYVYKPYSGVQLTKNVIVIRYIKYWEEQKLYLYFIDKNKLQLIEE